MSVVEQPVELTPLGFDILRNAVNLARVEQIRRLTTLRNRLNALYPDDEIQVEAALKFWASWAARNKSIHSIDRLG